MKRQIISWGMMLAAAFTLTNCAKEIDDPNEKPETNGYPFEIVASSVDTKTTNEGLATKWAAGDQINLFHAVTGANDDYKDNNAFTIAEEDLADSRFTGELTAALVSGTSYDWYAFYPYKSYITTPAAQTAGWTYIGGRSDTPQAQTGVNSMSHIAGENYPLCGKKLDVAYDVRPELVMSHASALLEVKVTNTLETELAVTSISFAALDNTSLVGQFYPCITGDEVTYTDGQYVSNVANLSVTEATIAAGASASFYLAVKPFTAANETELRITVNNDESTIKMTQDVKFSAGKIKTLNFTYDKVEEPAPEGTNEVTIDLTAQGYANAEVVTEVTSTPIKVSFNKGSASNSPAYYTSGTSVRVYAKASFTVESALGNITSIELTFGSSDKTNEITTNVGTFSTNTWTGSSKSVTFTIGETKDHRRIKTIKVTYIGDGGVIETEQLAAPTVTCAVVKSNSLTFEWEPVANATKYAVIFNGGEEELVENTSYTRSGLNSETEYSISVKALGDGIYYTDSEFGECSETTSAADQPGEGDNVDPVTIDITFEDYTSGTQYAISEEHKINEVLTLYTTQCHFTTQLRIYSSSTHNGFVVSNGLPGRITGMTFNAGNNVDELDIYGSNDGDTWTKVGSVSVASASYTDYSFVFGDNEYTYFKLDVAGSNQIRIAKMSVTYQPAN